MAINPKNFVSRGVFEGGVVGLPSWGLLLIAGAGLPVPVIPGIIYCALHCQNLVAAATARTLTVILEA